MAISNVVTTCLPAISSHSLGRAWIHALPNKLARAAAAGFPGIELFHEDVVYHAAALYRNGCINSVTTQDRLGACHDIVRLCRQFKLHIVCLQPFRNYEGLLDLEQHAAKLEDLQTWITMAHILQTDMIAIASSLEPEELITGDPARLAADLAVVADFGASAHPPIRFTFEALCFGTHVRSWQMAWQLVKTANRPNLGICIDTFNLAGWDYADPELPGGVRADGPQRLRDSLNELVHTVPREKIFYVQVVDAEKLKDPLQPDHPLYVQNQPARMTWSRACRLFYGETDRRAYMPIKDVMDAVLNGLNWRGWISMELFNRSLEEKGNFVPREHAERGIQSWKRLNQDFPKITAQSIGEDDVRLVDSNSRYSCSARANELLQFTPSSRL